MPRMSRIASTKYQASKVAARILNVVEMMAALVKIAIRYVYKLSFFALHKALLLVRRVNLMLHRRNVVLP